MDAYMLGGLRKGTKWSINTALAVSSFRFVIHLEMEMLPGLKFKTSPFLYVGNRYVMVMLHNFIGVFFSNLLYIFSPKLPFLFLG